MTITKNTLATIARKALEKAVDTLAPKAIQNVEPNQVHDVVVVASVSVDGVAHRMEYGGTVKTGKPSTRNSSSKPSADAVAAFLLSQLGPTAARKLAAAAKEGITVDPVKNAEAIALAKDLVESLTTTEPVACAPRATVSLVALPESVKESVEV
ncbi:hypothetical protein [Kordiimonas sp.]|uniref:hypothetical protein n=1 Tax=Kordiimonas sp. TaxID=1970157 RepID=UPI003A8EA64A